MRALSRYAWTLILLAVLTPAMAQLPQPGPEVKKLEAFVGAWRYEGEAKASPAGPAAKISGTQTGRMIMGGFALEVTGQEKGLFGDVQWGEVDVYDAASKSIRFLGYQNEGTAWFGSTLVNGNVWKSTGTQTIKGVSYKYRQESSFSADGNTVTWKAEISNDGKTWVPWHQGTMTKSK